MIPPSPSPPAAHAPGCRALLHEGWECTCSPPAAMSEARLKDIAQADLRTALRRAEIAEAEAARLRESKLSYDAAERVIGSEQEVGRLQDENTRLRAEVERLRGACRAIQKLGAPIDPKGIHADRVRAIAVAALLPGETP